MPGDGTLHNLTIYAGIVAKLVGGSPFLKVEKETEKLKDMLFVEQAETDRISQMAIENRGGLLKLS
jgi:hypothetical protein